MNKAKKISVSNLDADLIKAITTVKKYKQRLKLLRYYIFGKNKYFHYLWKYKQDASKSRARYYRMNNDIPEIEINNINGLTGILDNIFQLTEKYVTGSTEIEKEDLGARLDMLFKAGDMLIKAYEQETMRMHTVNERVSIITDRDRLMLEGAIVTGDEDTIKTIVETYSTEEITNRLLK